MTHETDTILLIRIKQLTTMAIKFTFIIPHVILISSVASLAKYIS